ncbi:MAG: DUF4316 domain-containing protein, partial [Oscillospiraceae bacterium]|nr:DUF4316 domain-containing protein [Oscillospiraceae bacterium]
MAEKQSYAEQNKARLKEITDSIETGIRELFQSDKYRQYLSTMSRFHRYSVNNVMLIHMQKPDATHVAGFNKWRDNFGRNVRKGEKGIKIIAPTPYKKKIEEAKLDPDTKLPMLDADGNAIMEEKTIQIPMYKVVSVFDVSQTEGKPLPELAEKLTGNVQEYEAFMEALKRSAPVPIRIEPMREDMDGYFSASEQRIAIREGMSQVQTVSAAVHEIAHSKLHNYQKEQEQAALENEAAPPVARKSRETEEIEAESISYAVCAYYGVETGANSFGYLASWSKDKELSALRESLETINKTSSGLISDIDRHYRDIMKERGLDKAEPEKEQKAEPTKGVEAPTAASRPFPDDYPMPDPQLTISDRDAYGYTENDMLPLSKERAVELFEQDVPVYMLYDDNSANMAFDRDDIDGHIGMFGVNREEWDAAREYLELAAGHELTEQELENSFLHNPADAFAIYQLKHVEQTRDLRFAPLEHITAAGIVVDRNNYDLVYTGSLDGNGSTNEKLEALFETFNVNRPEDFKGHSLSVSDIVALKQAGAVSFHYCDSAGFSEVPAFMKPENYLKNAEMALEDDYGMIDGIINNGPKQTT